MERLRLKRYDLKWNINRYNIPIAPAFCNRCGHAEEKGFDPWDGLELDALSERLKLKRYDIKRKINRYHSLIVRQLPPDVTSTIFEFCLPDFTNKQLSSSTKEDISIPLSLGAICSHWRDIAWSTPSLWSSLVVRVTSKHFAPDLAQEWLARSGQLPLSIRIYSKLYVHEALLALANIVNQYSNRWSDLDLHIPDTCYPYFHATDNHAPILKLIRFQCSAYVPILKNWNFPLTCPRLERATLSFFPIDASGINIQWDNLTHLTLHFMSIDSLFLILRTTPRLVFCKVLGYCSLYRGQSMLGPPVLTSLRSLQLQVPIFTEEFLNNLIAPHLEEFSLPKYYSPSMEAITSFFRRSACPLRSFSILFSIFPPYFEGFKNLLQSMPSLNTLSIKSITATTRYFGNVTPEDYDPRNVFQLVAKVVSSQSASQQGFLPNLKILKYTGKLNLRPEFLDDIHFLPPVDKTVHGPFHLLELDLYPATRIPKNMISYVSSLAGRGVTVNVLSGSEDILQSSIDYYRHREDSLCPDWADNLESSLFS